MSSEVPGTQEWIGGTLREIRALPAKVRERSRYREGGYLDHYQKLATELVAHYEDHELGAAAFLHGLPTDVIEDRKFVEGDALKILKEREQLVSLEPRDSDVPRLLVANMLPHISQARSLVLFVHDQLQHLDPQGQLSKWTRGFQLRPEELPDDLPAEPCFETPVHGFIMLPFARKILATTAEFIGMWHERNVVRNAVLYYGGEADRINGLVDFAVNSSNPTDICNQLVEIVESTWKSSAPTVSWEWRHLESLHRKLGDASPREWVAMLGRCGFVSVTCKNDEDCYNVLGDLHARFQYTAKGEFADYLGAPTPGGYRAIHTVLMLDEPAPVRRITVRIRPRREVRLYEDTPGPILLRNLQDRLDTYDETEGCESGAAKTTGREPGRPGFDFTVFAPDGARVDLPVGATVLNFAHEVHTGLVAKLRGATVNRKPASVLHQLRPGDVVWLDVADEEIQLPPNWGSKVPHNTRMTLARAYRHYYRPALRRSGRNYLRERLIAAGLPEVDNQALDTFVGEAAEWLRKDNVGPQKGLRESRDDSTGSVLPVDWWLEQLGILSDPEDEYASGFDLKINDGVAARVLKTIQQLMEATHFVADDQLALPNINAVQRLEICHRCQPHAGTQLDGTMDGDVLVLHRPASSCSEGGFTVNRRRHSPPPQFFTVETTNRVGVGVDVLAAFRDLEVDVVDLAGTRLQRSRAVMRIEVDYLDRRRVQRITEKLTDVRGVVRVFGPKDEASQFLEACLPPRRSFRGSTWYPPTPYVVGNPVTDEAHFYGMDAELASLKHAVDQSTEAGMAVSVTGPLRVGKTSIVRNFCNDLRRSALRESLVVYHEAAPGESWSQARGILASALSKTAGDYGIEIDDDAATDLEQVLAAVEEKRARSVVIILDEVAALLMESRRQGNLEELDSFCLRFISKPLHFLVLVGPEAPIRKSRLSGVSMRVWAKGQPIRVSGLNENSVKELLEAKKLRPRYSIRTEDSLVRRVHELTRGNVYWVALIAHTMWEISTRRNRNSITYDLSLLNKAMAIVLEESDYAFEDRFFSSDDKTGVLVWEILAALADKNADAPDGQVLSFGELQNLCSCSSPRTLERTLRDLQARGTLVHQRDKWRLAAPILADVVGYKIDQDVCVVS